MNAEDAHAAKVAEEERHAEDIVPSVVEVYSPCPPSLTPTATHCLDLRVGPGGGSKQLLRLVQGGGRVVAQRQVSVALLGSSIAPL